MRHGALGEPLKWMDSVVMNQKVVCSKCGGRGILIDADPTKPAIRCSCYQQRMNTQGNLGIPTRYQSASLEDFWAWWITEHPEATLLSQLDLANQLLVNPMSRGTLKNGLDLKLEHILQKCGYQPSNQGLGVVKQIRYALQPSGYDQLTGWALHGKSISNFWWISGAPQSGRSTLAAAVLRARVARTSESGLFVSIRTFSQELKDVYYDIRSFKNTDFQSERALMEPLMETSVLVIDDFDRLDNDIRIARAFAQLLDYRYAESKPTLITALQGPRQVLQSEQSPMLKLGDESLLRRLEQSQRVECQPTLKSLITLIANT